MEVILNAGALQDALTGIGQYVWRLSLGLENHASVAGVRYFYRYGLVSKTPAPGRKVAPWKRALRKIPYAPLAYQQLRNACFRYQTASLRRAIYHEPNFLLMPFDGPCVATIHDLSYLHFPQYHPKDRIERMTRGMPRTLERADALITDSEFVRGELIRLLNVPAGKVRCVPLGVDAAYQPRDRRECTTVLDRYGLKDRTYILAVGTLEPRKNLPGLVDAYSRLPVQLQRRFSLVLVGMTGWRTAALEAAVEPLSRDGRLIQLGYVAAEDIPFLYSAASAFAFPSFYEGFGLPPLEAMASGVPVVASKTSSIPELVGDAALLCDPNDPGDIAEKLKRALEDNGFRKAAAAAGPARAGLYSWQRCVNSTIAVYASCLELPSLVEN